MCFYCYQVLSPAGFDVALFLSHPENCKAQSEIYFSRGNDIFYNYSSASAKFPSKWKSHLDQKGGSGEKWRKGPKRFTSKITQVLTQKYFVSIIIFLLAF